MRYIAYHNKFEKPVKSKYLHDLKKDLEITINRSSAFDNFGAKIVEINFFGRETKHHIPKERIIKDVSEIIWKEVIIPKEPFSFRKLFKRIFC